MEKHCESRTSDVHFAPTYVRTCVEGVHMQVTLPLPLFTWGPGERDKRRAFWRTNALPRPPSAPLDGGVQCVYCNLWRLWRKFLCCTVGVNFFSRKGPTVIFIFTAVLDNISFRPNRS